MYNPRRKIKVGSNSYVPIAVQGEMMDNDAYARAQRETELVRSGNADYARSVRLGTSKTQRMTLAPPKPRAVGLSGMDMFGAESFTSSTTRGMSLDLRGEAVSPEKAMRDAPPPTGGGISSLSGRSGEKPLAKTMRATAVGSKSGKTTFSKSPFGIGSRCDYTNSTAMAAALATRSSGGDRKVVNYNPAVLRAPVVAPPSLSDAPQGRPVRQSRRRQAYRATETKPKRKGGNILRNLANAFKRS